MAVHINKVDGLPEFHKTIVLAEAPLPRKEGIDAIEGLERLLKITVNDAVSNIADMDLYFYLYNSKEVLSDIGF